MLSAQDEVVGVDLRLPKKPIYLQSREWKIRPLCFCTGEEFIKSHTELFLYNWQWHRCKVETGLYLSYLKWCIEHLSVYPTANSFCKSSWGSPGATLIVISYSSKISQATCCLQYPLFQIQRPFSCCLFVGVECGYPLQLCHMQYYFKNIKCVRTKLPFKQ